MKKILIISLISLGILNLVGCEQNLITTTNDQYLQDGFEFISKGSKIDEIRNIETGVHYYLRNSGNIGGLSPVYNSDGTVKITK